MSKIIFSENPIILLFLISLVAGFIASVPIGPVNLWTANLLISRGKKAVYWFLSGVILIDITYVFLGFWVYFFISDKGITSINSGWEIIGGIFIMLVGFLFLVKNQKKVTEQKLNTPSYYHPLKAFFTGAVLCASNSMLFVMWFFIASVYQSYGLEVTNSWALFTVVLGVLAGDIIWFGSFVKVLEKGLTRIQPMNLRRIQNLIAISLVLFGLFTACKQIGS